MYKNKCLRFAPKKLSIYTTHLEDIPIEIIECLGARRVI